MPWHFLILTPPRKGGGERRSNSSNFFSPPLWLFSILEDDDTLVSLHMQIRRETIPPLLFILPCSLFSVSQNFCSSEKYLSRMNTLERPRLVAIEAVDMVKYSEFTCFPTHFCFPMSSKNTFFPVFLLSYSTRLVTQDFIIFHWMDTAWHTCCCPKHRRLQLRLRRTKNSFTPLLYFSLSLSRAHRKPAQPTLRRQQPLCPNQPSSSAIARLGFFSLSSPGCPFTFGPSSSFQFFFFRPRPTTTELPTVGRSGGQSQLRALLLLPTRLQFCPPPPLSAFEEDPSCLAMGGSRSSKKRRRRRRKAGVQAALTLPLTQIAMTSFGKQRTHC